MAHQVIIDCDRRRVTTYTQDNVCVMFQGDIHYAYLEPCMTIGGTSS